MTLRGKVRLLGGGVYISIPYHESFQLKNTITANAASLKIIYTLSYKSQQALFNIYIIYVLLLRSNVALKLNHHIEIIEC